MPNQATPDTPAAPTNAVRDGRWRVVYGETMPAWEKRFSSRRAARTFAKEHEGFGDIISDISKVVEGEPPKSIAAAIAKAEGRA